MSIYRDFGEFSGHTSWEYCWEYKILDSMTTEDLKCFISFILDGGKVQYLSKESPYVWKDSHITKTGVFNMLTSPELQHYVLNKDAQYRVKPKLTERDLKIIELEVSAKRIQRQIQELKSL